jgi:predicted lipoprotein with Yx(FWY)xxD motif
MTRPALAMLAVAAAAALAAGCGDDDDTTRDTAAAAPTAAPTAEPTAAATPAAAPAKKARAARGTRVRLVDSQFGRILGDRRGQAFYFFDKETSRRSRCYGDCARAWPPVLTKGRPVAGKGARASLLGTTRRRDGKLQVTYRDRPLYYYVDDEPGLVLCHNVQEFGGLWLVVKRNGTPVA